jgi:predicted anti-sigma-YlaC factor YlaD
MLAGGLLDSHERLTLQAHVDGCAECRAELAEIAPVARLLPNADPDRVADQAIPGTRLTLQVFGAIAAERRARNRRRLTQAAVSLSAAAAVIVGLVVLTGPDPGRPVEFAQAPPGVTATATVEDRAWGTQVQLAVAGLADGVEHAVWLERADGSRVPAGTFTADGARTLSVTLAAAAPLAEAVAVGISDDTGDTVLRAPAPPPPASPPAQA